MNIPRFRHSFAPSMLCVWITIEWCAVILSKCFWVRLSGFTCITPIRFLLEFSSSISSLTMTSSSLSVRSRSFLGTPCSTSPYLRFLICAPSNTGSQFMVLSSGGSSSVSQWSRYSSFESLLMPCILGMRPSLIWSSIALWHFWIRSLACIDFIWFFVVSGAIAADILIVSFSRCCFLILSFTVFLFFLLAGVSGGFAGGGVAAICAKVGAVAVCVTVGFSSIILMSFSSLDIIAIVCCFSSSSSFSRFCVMVLACSRASFALITNPGLVPVVVLMLLMLLIASVSRISTLVRFGGGCCFCSGVVVSVVGDSGIAVPERYFTVPGEGVSSRTGVVLPWEGVLSTGHMVFLSVSIGVNKEGGGWFLRVELETDRKTMCPV